MKNFMQKFWYSFLVCSMLQTATIVAMDFQEPVDTSEETTQQRAARLERQKRQFEEQKDAQDDLAVTKEREIQDKRIEIRRALDEPLSGQGFSTLSGTVSSTLDNFKSLTQDYQSSSNATARKNAAMRLILQTDSPRAEQLTAEAIKESAQARIKEIESTIYQSELANRFANHAELQATLSDIENAIQSAAKLLISETDPSQAKSITTNSYQQYRSMLERSYEFNSEVRPAAQAQLATKLLFGDDADIANMTTDQITQKVLLAQKLIEENTNNAWVKAIELLTIEKAQAMLLKEIAQRNITEIQRQQTRPSTPTQPADQPNTAKQAVAAELSRQLANQPRETPTASIDPKPATPTDVAKPSKSLGDHATDVLNSVKRWVLSLFDFSKGSYVRSITADAMANDQTAVDHIGEEFSNPKTKALDFTKKQEIVKALQDQANEFYNNEAKDLTGNTQESRIARKQLDQRFQAKCSALVSSIEPMLTDSQRLLRTFKPNGEVVVSVVDLSTFQFNFESQNPTAARLDLFALEQDVPGALKDQLRNALEQYKTDLPAKFERATGAEKTALAAQILGLDPKAAPQAAQALFLIAEIKKSINAIQILPEFDRRDVKTRDYSNDFHSKSHEDRAKIDLLTYDLYTLLSEDGKENRYFKSLPKSFTKEISWLTDFKGNKLNESRTVAFNTINFDSLSQDLKSIEESLNLQIKATLSVKGFSSSDIIQSAQQALALPPIQK